MVTLALGEAVTTNLTKFTRSICPSELWFMVIGAFQVVPCSLLLGDSSGVVRLEAEFKSGDTGTCKDDEDNGEDMGDDIVVGRLDNFPVLHDDVKILIQMTKILIDVINFFIIFSIRNNCYTPTSCTL
jgi:hypothetical protein